MKLSMINVSSGLLVLAAAAMLLATANAGYNGPTRNYNQGNYNQPRANNMNAVGRYQCQGNHCNSNNYSNRNPFGPYHTYAVRPKPAYYGGRGLYYYRGYARQPAGGKQYRPKRQNNRACYGPNCPNRYNRNNRRRPQGYKAPAAQNLNGLRPVNVLVLSVPPKTNNYQAGGYSSSNNNNNSNNNRPYGAQASNFNNGYNNNNSNKNGASYSSNNNGASYSNTKSAPLRNAGGY